MALYMWVHIIHFWLGGHIKTCIVSPTQCNAHTVHTCATHILVYISARSWTNYRRQCLQLINKGFAACAASVSLVSTHSQSCEGLPFSAEHVMHCRCQIRPTVQQTNKLSDQIQECALGHATQVGQFIFTSAIVGNSLCLHMSKGCSSPTE